MSSPATATATATVMSEQGDKTITGDNTEHSLREEISNRGSWPSELGSSRGSALSTSNWEAGSRDRLEMATPSPVTPSEPLDSSFGTATIVSTFKQSPPVTCRKVPVVPPPPPRPITPPPEGDRVTSAAEICIVCLSSIKFLPENPPTSSCTHLSQVCRPCLARTIDSVVQNGDLVDGMRCPTTGCRALLAYTDVQSWSEGGEEAGIEQLFEKYQAKLIRRTLNAEEDFVWCLGKACTSGQYHTGGDERPMITCDVCKTKQCFRHKSLWHDGFTCMQWDLIGTKNAYSDGLSRKKILTITKACPGPGCKMRHEKNGGCFTLSCITPHGCGAYYCWECSAIGCIHYDNCIYYNGVPGQNPAPPVAPNLDPALELILPPDGPSRWRMLGFTRRLRFWKIRKEVPAPLTLPAPDDPLAFKQHEL